METLITVGYVQVYVAAYDCDGMQRTIDFPRIGKKLCGNPLCHWSCKPFIKEARQAAINALKFVKASGR